MSKQNPTVEDSEEYKKLIKRHNKLLNNNIKLADWILKVEDMLKQFHYGPVNEDYKARVKTYIEENGL